MTETLIKTRELRKSFGQTRAVDGLNLAVAGGEVYGLIGPDGAGKTTALRLMCGALRADTGHIEIAGFDLGKHTEEARSQIGYLPQRFSFYEDLTVLENIRFFSEVRGLKADEWYPRSMEILDFVGLSEFKDRRVRFLSGGMKQKLGLAAALVHQPRVLLLDEPTTGVDPVTRQDFWKLIIRLEAGGNVAVLISTPYMDEASRCSQVGFMRNGRMLLEGPPEKLKQRLSGRILEIQGQPLQTLRKIAITDVDVEDAQLFGDRLHLRTRVGRLEGASNRLKAVTHEMGYSISSIREVPPQLEDVFIEFLVAGQDE